MHFILSVTGSDSTNICSNSKPFIKKQFVSIDVSHCYSYEIYSLPQPTYMCVLKCDTIPACIATGSDSVHMTSTCCTLVEKDITVVSGDSAIIHQSDYRVCLASDWIGRYSYRLGNKAIFAINMRFQGLADNCSNFTGISTESSYYLLHRLVLDGGPGNSTTSWDLNPCHWRHLITSSIQPTHYKVS